jgi:hypothetical protein
MYLLQLIGTSFFSALFIDERLGKWRKTEVFTYIYDISSLYSHIKLGEHKT